MKVLSFITRPKLNFSPFRSQASIRRYLSSQQQIQKNVPEKTLNLDLELPTNDKSENLLKIRHSTAHVMAMAVQKLFPDVKVTIGPWIDHG
jgi:threonyl-tRNA synthetase